MDVFRPDTSNTIELPLFTTHIPAGFPSPADDFIENKLDLNELLIKHPVATFFVRVQGDSMINAGIHNSDILVVDRSLEAKHNKIIIAVINGELTVKRLIQKDRQTFLFADNPKYKPVQITQEMAFQVWGVVTSVIHTL